MFGRRALFRNSPLAWAWTAAILLLAVSPRARRSTLNWAIRTGVALFHTLHQWRHNARYLKIEVRNQKPLENQETEVQFGTIDSRTLQ